MSSRTVLSLPATIIYRMAGGNSTKTKTPRAARLPARTLKEAVALAQALKDYAVPASKAVIAGHNGETMSSSAFKSKFAAAGYYGLLAKEGEKYKLTERGEAVLAGDDQAKRDAVMATGFGSIIGSLATRPVSPKILEGRLKSDYSVNETSADTLCKVLIESAEDAGLVADGKFDAKAIESVDTATVVPQEATAKKPVVSDGGRARQRNTPPSKSSKDPPKPDSPTRTVAPVQVVVQLDGSKMEPAKIAELVRLLQEPN